MRGLLIAVIAVAATANAGLSAEPSSCKGDFPPKNIKNRPYDFIVNSRLEIMADYQLITTCVQNNTNGFFRFNWHIPGHRVDLTKAGAHENPRPFAKEDFVQLELGCLSFGNLNDSDKKDSIAMFFLLKAP